MVRQGYKQTAVGVIPEDWDIVAIKTLATDMSDGPFGSNLKKEHYTGEKQARIIQLSNIGENGWLDENVKYTTFSHAKTISRCIVQPGNIIIAKMMPAGRAIICPNTEEMYVLGSDSIKLQLNAALVNTAYFMYSTKSRFFQTQIKEETQGSTRARTSISKLRKNNVFLPPLPEQELIAEALSDIDNMISSLEKLIVKKKAVKQGAMQELLTGKKRLSGFASEWKKIKFKETNIEVLKGQTITQKEISTGNIPVIAGGKTPAYYCDKFNRTGKNITISASGASAGFVNKYSGNIFASDCSTISESYKYNIDFIYYLLLNMQTAIYASQTGGAQPHIHPNDIYELDIYYTFDLSEQNTIASILSDMDSEIEALEQKLEKTRQIKQGMMLQLLTGKIRLI